MNGVVPIKLVTAVWICSKLFAPAAAVNRPPDAMATRFTPLYILVAASKGLEPESTIWFTQQPATSKRSQKAGKQTASVVDKERSRLPQQKMSPHAKQMSSRNQRTDIAYTIPVVEQTPLWNSSKP